jgi:hypothetical protein
MQINTARRQAACTELHCRIFARSIPMMDVVMVALAFGFCALSIAYAYACERL